jgi:uncharacterized protein (DUF736 family)
MAERELTEFEKAWEEVGAVWNNEKSKTLKLSKDLTVSDKVILTINKTDNEKAPAFRVWRKK